MYLGTYTVTPNTKEVQLDCFGTSYPKQRETLEQEGINAYVELETVEHEGVEVTDFLSPDILDYLTAKLNEK